MDRLRTTARLLHTVFMIAWMSLCCCGLQHATASALACLRTPGAPSPGCCGGDHGHPDNAPPSEDPGSPEHRCDCRGLIESTLLQAPTVLDHDTVGTAVLTPRSPGPTATPAATVVGRSAARDPGWRCPPATLLRLRCALTI